MTLHLDHKTAQLSTETRRLWHDVRVWMVNCVAIESAWPRATLAEKERVRRGCDQMLAAFLEAW
jgi:hypothetical protein